MVYNFIITMILGLTGGYIGKKSKLPAGVMIISMVVVATFNIIFQKGYLYPVIRQLMQIISGMIIGSKIDKKALQSLSKLVIPAILFIFVIGFYNFVIAHLVTFFTDIDLATAIFSTTLGGMTDLTILASEFNVDQPVVAVLHLMRYVFIMLVLPFIAKKMSQKDTTKEHVNYQQEKTEFNLKDFLFCFIISAAAGYILNFFHISGGLMIGSMIASSIFNITFKKVKVHGDIVFYLKCVAGTYVGLKFTKDLVFLLPSLYKAAIIILAGLIVYILTFSTVMKKLTGFNNTTSLLMCAPGALSDMVLLSEELGGDSYSIAAMQTLRMTSIVVVVPFIVSFLD